MSQESLCFMLGHKHQPPQRTIRMFSVGHRMISTQAVIGLLWVWLTHTLTMQWSNCVLETFGKYFMSLIKGFPIQTRVKPQVKKIPFSYVFQNCTRIGLFCNPAPLIEQLWGWLSIHCYETLGPLSVVSVALSLNGLEDLNSNFRTAISK